MANFRKSTAWFASLFIFLVVGLMSLGTCNSTEQTRDSTQVDETMVTEADESEETEVPEEEFVDYSQLASESDPDWVKPPYYHDSTASYIPDMYGMIAQNAREDHIGKSFFPSIQGLYFNSCMESCRRDYCKSKRAVLAISCPEKVPLLRWVSYMACDFVNGCIDDSLKHISPNNSLKSAKEMFDYYIDGKKHKYFCDFLLNGENVEIKGRQLINRETMILHTFPHKIPQLEKTKCLRDNNVRIIIDDDEEILRITKIVEKQFPKLVASCRVRKNEIENDNDDYEDEYDGYDISDTIFEM